MSLELTEGIKYKSSVDDISKPDYFGKFKIVNKGPFGRYISDMFNHSNTVRKVPSTMKFYIMWYYETLICYKFPSKAVATRVLGAKPPQNIF